MMKLNAQAIKQSLNQSSFNLEKPLRNQHMRLSCYDSTAFSKFNIHILDSVDSTNHFVKNLPPSTSIDVCCSEEQTKGIGRLGRKWYSPFGENIYCSSRWHFDRSYRQLSGLSLVCSLAILKTLSTLFPLLSFQVKWPNDIYWQNKKICGILIESSILSTQRIEVIIGIGLNVNMNTSNHPAVDKPWCSLFDLTQQESNRNHIIATLLNHLEHYLEVFKTYGLNAFMTEWIQADYLLGKQVCVAQSTHVVSGLALGVDELGQLLVKDTSGTQWALSSGDATLLSRPN
jgi:BirA family transcriptional regulator, biotin operon repressor / biotin---[acetyl-CoA-carboxylase] ligase